MLTRLEAQNFKALGPEPVAIELGAVNVLVGTNGSGKTSMIEVPAILSQSAWASSATGLIPAGSLTELHASGDYRESREMLFHRRELSAWMRLGIEFGIDTSTLYAPAPPGWKREWPPRVIGLQVQTRGRADEAEWVQVLIAAGKEFARWTTTHNGARVDRRWTNTFTMPGMLEKPVETAPWASRVLDQQMYHALNLSPRELYIGLAYIFDLLRQLLAETISYVSPVRGQALMDRKTGAAPFQVGKHGEETLRLLSLIYSQPGDPASILQKWAPRFGMNDLRAGWAGQDSLRVTFKDPSSQTSISDLSFAGSGSKQVLPILVELARSGRRSTVFLDEPELSLHPKWILELARVIAEAGQRGVQVVIATQMPSLVLALASCVREGSLTRDQLRIWEFTRDEARASASEIEVTATGHLKAWPQGYAAADQALLKGVLGVEEQQAQERPEDRPRRKRPVARTGRRRAR